MKKQFEDEDNPYKAARRTWEIDPRTRIKEPKKKYKRQDNKKEIEKEIDNE